MKKLLLFLIVLFLASCRVGDCGCPMAGVEKENVDLDNRQTDYPNRSFNLTESRLRYHRRNDIWLTGIH